MNVTIPNTKRAKFTDPSDPGADKYLARIDAQFDDLRDRFDRIVAGWREDIAKLRALVQADIDRMDAESLLESTVCRERVAPGGCRVGPPRPPRRRHSRDTWFWRRGRVGQPGDRTRRGSYSLGM